MTRAFVLGAGLGTRLRPLTSQLPKPLIPLHHRPLIEYAFEHLHGTGISEFVVNTHHLPDAFQQAFPDRTWRGCPVAFRHEPVLLETGGGLANVADLLGSDETFAVYNGDVFTSLPLAPALDEHSARQNLVTLVLRSTGPVKNVALDVANSRVIDLRNLRGTNHPDQFQFTGLCIIEPAFFRFLRPRGEIESLVPAWLRAIEAGCRIGGTVIDEGLWLDLGDRESYLAAHRLVPATQRVHPKATVDPSADIDDVTSIGPDCVIGGDAVIRRSVLWPGAKVSAGTCLDDCVVMSGHTAGGVLKHAAI